jgi:hypothetical protein
MLKPGATDLLRHEPSISERLSGTIGSPSSTRAAAMIPAAFDTAPDEHAGDEVGVFLGVAGAEGAVALEPLAVDDDIEDAGHLTRTYLKIV